MRVALAVLFVLISNAVGYLFVYGIYCATFYDWRYIGWVLPAVAWVWGMLRWIQMTYGDKYDEKNIETS